MAQGVAVKNDSALSTLRAVVALSKPRISALVSMLAATAFYLYRPFWDVDLFGFAVSIGVLTMGASALNNFQDRKIDANFERTRNRPLPQKQLSQRAAVALSLTWIAIGILGLSLFSVSPIHTVICAMISVTLYNGIYTPLKRKTVLAIVPGTVVGAFPVLFGWLGAGGALWSKSPWVMMIVTAVWQLPHFWLVLLSHSSEYSRSDLPNMLRLFSIDQLRRLTLVWVTVFGVLTLLLPLFGLIVDMLSIWILGINAALIIVAFAFATFIKLERRNYTALFIHLNVSMMVILISVII